MHKHIHILGICGTFMGGVAKIAKELGYRVTGSDENIYPPMSTLLQSLGIEILPGYKVEHLTPTPEIVLIGNVCKRGDEVIEYVLNNNIPFMSGPQWLYETVLQKRHVLAVAGTHGKTTTTSMLTWILQEAGLNPGYLIGGVAHDFTSSATLGQAPYFVIEADEYDTAFFDKKPKFLHYFPTTLVINNIEFDHGDIYQDLAAIKLQFHYLIRSVSGKGLILYPQEDHAVNEVISKGVWSETQCFTGTSAPLSVKLINPDGSEFEVFHHQKSCGKIKWQMMGRHNVENALAAILAAQHVGVSPEKAVSVLSRFKGIKRRLELVGEAKGISIYDDFAHHPTAIFKTLAALRARVGRRPIIAVLQFGSNTMSQGGHESYKLAEALQQADRVVILGSQALHTYIQQLAKQLNSPLVVCESVQEIIAALTQQLGSGDSVLIMSNKGFGGLQHKLLQSLNTVDIRMN